MLLGTVHHDLPDRLLSSRCLARPALCHLSLRCGPICEVTPALFKPLRWRSEAHARFVTEVGAGWPCELCLGFAQSSVGKIPWRLLLSKPPVWALIISHFCHNWGTFILLTWMPTYYNQARHPEAR